MTDRELLELTAKADGISGYVGCDMGRLYFCTPADPRIPHSDPAIYFWLDDVGDAFSLAIRLGMKLSTDLHHRFVMANDEQIFYDESKFGGLCDPEGAMCRAIVQAAAEIGRKMK